ncbi:MAG TPA: PEP-utilizing enzyme [Candidatus Bathyarchaeia archaeon]|nr:PEP-utilizing enzyme [Candidatus Bathyarchaeia archaeon]
MIKLKMKELAKKLNKSISDISRETGLNRNSVTALFHGKVDGIKFDTLEKICSIYEVSISDVLEILEEKKKNNEEKLYRQEGAMVPFTGWPPFFALNDVPKKYFGDNFGKGYWYGKKDYMYAYWNYDQMNKISNYMLGKYYQPKQIDGLFKIYSEYSLDVENIYYSCSAKKISEMDSEELKFYFNGLKSTLHKFWQYCIFIDGFDIGVDYEKIQEVAKKYKLSTDEIGILTTPYEMTFGNERSLTLFEIIKKLKRKKIDQKNIDAVLAGFIKDNPIIEKYKLDFDYYKSNYAHIEHIEDGEITREIKKYLADPDLFQKEYEKLSDYAKNQKKKVATILKAHKLKVNPLYFFAKLTYWREHRKKINLMSIHVLNAILDSLEIWTGIPKKYLGYLSFDEFEITLKGLMSIDVLHKRRDKGMVIILPEDGSYKILEGREAQSLRDEVEEKLGKKDKGQDIIAGKVASQGYAKGTARIIADRKDFDKFQEGDILVTGMTRPEFVPLMKKAAAIVTNEGGITCHAAIVSRELGKPCIIGTKFATEVIKDGDLVEVRANHGTVRIIR